MNVSSLEARSIGRCLSRSADMPMTCFCQEAAVASQVIALYILGKLALSGIAWWWYEQPNPSTMGDHG